MYERSHRRFAVWLAIVATLCATLGIAQQTAHASTVRPMAWNRYDILLNGDETRLAATSYWGAAWVCAAPIVAASRGGAVGIFAAATICPAVVSTCAARAYLKHRWAGITVTPFTLGWWCWDY